MLLELKYIDFLFKRFLSKDLGIDFLDLYVEVMVFICEKYIFIVFLVMLVIGDLENEYRMRCNLILFIKERGVLQFILLGVVYGEVFIMV